MDTHSDFLYLVKSFVESRITGPRATRTVNYIRSDLVSVCMSLYFL